MSYEKVPQVLIVDLESGEAQKARKQYTTYRLPQVVAIAFFTFLFTAMTTVCMIPSSRHALVAQNPLAHVSETLQNIIKRNLDTRDDTPRNIIFPLYIDPGENGANWTKIYNAAKAYPNVQFTVVINPFNGPNTSTIDPDTNMLTDGPDPNYKAGLDLLTAYNNVQVIGYVPQGYGARDFDDVMRDVHTWSTWGNDDMYGNALSGIFFDEGTAEEGEFQVLARKINTATKAMSGFGGDAPFIVQNPGILPAAVYFEDEQNCDLTIILEDSYAEYKKTKSTFNGIADKYNTDNSHFAFIFAGLARGSYKSIQKAIKPMLKQANYLFITNLTDDIYGQFGSNWMAFVQALSTL